MAKEGYSLSQKKNIYLFLIPALLNKKGFFWKMNLALKKLPWKNKSIAFFLGHKVQ